MKMDAISNAALCHCGIRISKCTVPTPGPCSPVVRASKTSLATPSERLGALHLDVGVQIDAVVTGRCCGEVACPAHQGPRRTVPPVRRRRERRGAGVRCCRRAGTRECLPPDLPAFRAAKRSVHGTVELGRTEAVSRGGLRVLGAPDDRRPVGAAAETEALFAPGDPGEEHLALAQQCAALPQVDVVPPPPWPTTLSSTMRPTCCGNSAAA